jgi:hypothetical protein
MRRSPDEAKTSRGRACAGDRGVGAAPPSPVWLTEERLRELGAEPAAVDFPLVVASSAPRFVILVVDDNDDARAMLDETLEVLERVWEA